MMSYFDEHTLRDLATPAKPAEKDGVDGRASLPVV